jgi:hypothetical protein
MGHIMATEIEQLFIRIGAITKGFDEAMNRVERKVKDAPSKLAINPQVNITSLKSLNSEMDRLQKRAAELRGHLLTVKPTVENPNAIKDLEHELAKVESRMTLVGKAADDVRGRIARIGEVGDKINAIGNKLTMGLTLPIVAAGTAFMMLTGKTGEYAEEIANLEQSTGLTAKQLQVLKFTAENAGLSFENITTAASMVQSKLMGVEDDSGGAAKAFAALGIGIHQANGELKPMSELFPQVIAKLQGMTNQTERNMYASQIFGRGWRELAPILSMTTAEMDTAAQRAEQLGLVMSDEALEAARGFDDSLDDLKQTAAGVGRELSTDLIPVLKNDIVPLLRQGIELVGAFVRWFNELPDPVKKTAGAGLLMLAAFGPLLKVVGSAVSIFASFKLAAAAAGLSAAGAGTATAGAAAAMGTALPAIVAVTGAVGTLWLAWKTAAYWIEVYQNKQKDKRVNASAENYIRDSKAGKIQTVRQEEEARAQRGELGPFTAQTPAAAATGTQPAAQSELPEPAYKTPGGNVSSLVDPIMKMLAKVTKEREKQSKEALEKQRANLEAETQAYENAYATQLELSGRTREAEEAKAVTSFNRQVRELQRLQAAGENVYYRWYDAASNLYKSLGEIHKDYSDRQVKRELETAQKREQATIDILTKAQALYEDYSDRLTKFLYGDTGLRINQLTKEYNAESALIEKSTADHQTKADMLKVLWDNYQLKIAEVHADERDDFQENIGFIEEMKRGVSVNFSSAEQLWKNAVTAGIQTPSLAFAGPQVNQSFTGPSVNMQGMGMGQVATLLQDTNSKLERSVRLERDIRDQLTPH